MLPRRLSKTVARSLLLRQSPRHAPPPQLNLARRAFSDKLMGFSPMAPSAPSSPQQQGESRIPTAKDVTTAGGIWAPTSAKRDKLNELRTELKDGMESLDDAATESQLQDLYLVDGLQLISKTIDSTTDITTPVIAECSEWLVEQQAKMPEGMDKDKWEAHLAIVKEHIDTMKNSHISSTSNCLKDVRDYLDPTSIEEQDELEKHTSEPLLQVQDEPFSQAVLLLRFQLMEAAMEHFLASWDACTTVSDGDVDRAATQGISVEPQARTLPTAKVYKYLFAHLSGSCSERVDAAWDFIDKDDDGLLDESEITLVAELCLAPVQLALPRLFELALNEEPATEADLAAAALEASDGDAKPSPPQKGWRQRRREANMKKQLIKMFDKAVQKTFEDEVEMPHRLRCIYAWAEKAHQDNKLESIMVESGWSDRKRYVELSPKISLPEFREVQREHFTHLDRIGTEILKSYREDLWVLQGKGRERKELMRDSALFMAVVSLADYLILAS
ncbi:unnamed protein product [Cylindrotheca closterium]|uniref:EF-hand domain-containing protein n=1 Tax=Cylindrotheca closterium TaxID=2856 RepID=A0AAD2GDG8_9STRA|nr:unnamed protein product [Cylindrotheca closterium]